MCSDDRRITKIVKEWYTKTARDEWERLQRDPYHQIEFITTTHFLEKYLPDRGLILDAGGGPGRYTIELAKREYDVILLDITPKLLDIAKEEIEKAGVQGRVKQIVEGSITELAAFTDETFDAVLCLGGPLNHLLDEGQRRRASEELVRVARRGSPPLRIGDK